MGGSWGLPSSPNPSRISHQNGQDAQVLSSVYTALVGRKTRISFPPTSSRAVPKFLSFGFPGSFETKQKRFDMKRKPCSGLVTPTRDNLCSRLRGPADKLRAFRFESMCFPITDIVF